MERNWIVQWFCSAFLIHCWSNYKQWEHGQTWCEQIATDLVPLVRYNCKGVNDNKQWTAVLLLSPALTFPRRKGRKKVWNGMSHVYLCWNEQGVRKIRRRNPISWSSFLPSFFLHPFIAFLLYALIYLLIFVLRLEHWCVLWTKQILEVRVSHN